MRSWTICSKGRSFSLYRRSEIMRFSRAALLQLKYYCYHNSPHTANLSVSLSPSTGLADSAKLLRLSAAKLPELLRLENYERERVYSHLVWLSMILRRGSFCGKYWVSEESHWRRYSLRVLPISVAGLRFVNDSRLEA